MDPNIFRAYSIRGIADESLTVQDMTLIGQAVGTVLGEASISNTVVGRDYRHSSPRLAAALIQGLLATGPDAIDIGVCPTPLLNFATDHYGAGAGLMVTASHNPPIYNGLKIRTDHTLRGSELKQIYQIAIEGAFRQGQGALTHAEPTATYVDAICERVEMGRGLKVVVDAGNGTAGPIVPRLLARLGCQVIPLYCEPDGHFPNRVPDPTAPGALEALSAKVVAEGADAGLAYDGDGDRLAMVDETGQPVFADRLLTLLAREALLSHPGAKVVYEVSCTQALPETVRTLGGEAIPCPVGYAFVHETMCRTGAIIGGEAAGHLFFADPDFQFDDAVLATAKMIALLSRSNGSLSTLMGKLPVYFPSLKYRFHCPDDKKHDVVAYVLEHWKGHEIERIDGAKVHFLDGWGLFRVSNTQPAVTLHCEAKTQKRLDEIESMMLDAVSKALASVEVEMSSAH
jgi:phosphomannomutase/phosphoglucomutase